MSDDEKFKILKQKFKGLKLTKEIGAGLYSYVYEAICEDIKSSSENEKKYAVKTTVYNPNLIDVKNRYKNYEILYNKMKSIGNECHLWNIMNIHYYLTIDNWDNYKEFIESVKTTEIENLIYNLDKTPIDEEFFSIKNEKNEDKLSNILEIIIMEYVDITIQQMIDKRTKELKKGESKGDDTSYNNNEQINHYIIFQLHYTILTLLSFGIIANDVHTENIGLKKNKNNIIYKINDCYINVPSGYNIKLIDFHDYNLNEKLDIDKIPHKYITIILRTLISTIKGYLSTCYDIRYSILTDEARILFDFISNEEESTSALNVLYNMTKLENKNKTKIFICEEGKGDNEISFRYLQKFNYK